MFETIVRLRRGVGKLNMALACGLLAAQAAAAQQPAAEPIVYTLGYELVPPGILTVEMRVDDAPLPQTLAIPRAIPMGYGEQPYDSFVDGLEAFGPGGRPLQVSRGDGPRWIIGGAGQLGIVRYSIDLRRLESEIRSASDASKARRGYVGLLGYSVFAYLEGLEGRPARLRVEPPERWPAFSTLAPAAARLGGVRARANDYYALADSQVLMGPDLEVRHVDGKPPLFVATYAETDLDAARVAQTGREALDALVAYFGSAPFPHYSIVVEVLRPVSPDHQYGFSMEHMDSGTFFLDERGALTDESPERDVRRTRYNYAHHIAHSWIPKRASGPGYFPFSWSQAPILDTIWFSEGFAQYAALVALAEQMGEDGDAYRAAVIDSRFRDTLAAAPDFIRAMDTVELSRVASTRYSEDFRTGSGSFSRGGMMAYEMDEQIRAETRGRLSLKEALHHLVAWSARERRPFEVHEIPRLLSEATGVGLGDIFDKWMAAPGPSPD